MASEQNVEICKILDLDPEVYADQFEITDTRGNLVMIHFTKKANLRDPKVAAIRGVIIDMGSGTRLNSTSYYSTRVVVDEDSFYTNPEGYLVIKTEFDDVLRIPTGEIYFQYFFGGVGLKVSKTDGEVLYSTNRRLQALGTKTAEGYKNPSRYGYRAPFVDILATQLGYEGIEDLPSDYFFPEGVKYSPYTVLLYLSHPDYFQEELLRTNNAGFGMYFGASKAWDYDSDDDVHRLNISGNSLQYPDVGERDESVFMFENDPEQTPYVYEGIPAEVAIRPIMVQRPVGSSINSFEVQDILSFGSQFVALMATIPPPLVFFMRTVPALGVRDGSLIDSPALAPIYAKLSQYPPEIGELFMSALYYREASRKAMVVNEKLGRGESVIMVWNDSQSGVRRYFHIMSKAYKSRYDLHRGDFKIPGQKPKNTDTKEHDGVNLYNVYLKYLDFAYLDLVQLDQLRLFLDNVVPVRIKSTYDEAIEILQTTDAYGLKSSFFDYDVYSTNDVVKLSLEDKILSMTLYFSYTVNPANQLEAMLYYRRYLADLEFTLEFLVENRKNYPYVLKEIGAYQMIKDGAKRRQKDIKTAKLRVDSLLRTAERATEKEIRAMGRKGVKVSSKIRDDIYIRKIKEALESVKGENLGHLFKFVRSQTGTTSVPISDVRAPEITRMSQLIPGDTPIVPAESAKATSKAKSGKRPSKPSTKAPSKTPSKASRPVSRQMATKPARAASSVPVATPSKASTKEMASIKLDY